MITEADSRAVDFANAVGTDWREATVLYENGNTITMFQAMMTDSGAVLQRIDPLDTARPTLYRIHPPTRLTMVEFVVEP